MVDVTVADERRDFYVYVIFRENGEPCYVGKGCRGRWKTHVTKSHNLHLQHIYAKAAVELPVVKVREGLTDDGACTTEMALIAAIGREKSGGPLVNLTDGGDGTAGFNAPKSAAHRLAIGTALKGIALSEERRQKISLATKGRLLSAAHRAKLTAANTGKVRGSPSAQTRAKIRTALIGQTHSVETKAKMSAAGRGATKSPAHREGIGAAQRGLPKSEASRANMSAAARANSARTSKSTASWHASMTPEQKLARSLKISAAVKARMADPAVHAKVVAAAKSRGASMALNFRKAANENGLHDHKNPKHRR